MRHRLKSMLIFLLTGYLLLLALMFIFQRHLMYHPVRELEPPAQYGLHDIQEASVTADDGVRLTLWHHAAQPGYPTLLYFHGNGGNLANRGDKITTYTDAGFGLVGLSYRGYGSSQGSPSEEGFYRDARATITYARDVLGVDEKHMILYGESLGTGVAVQMATEYPVGGIVLEAPYTSITRRSWELYPFVPTSILLLDKFESLKKIDKVHSPLLIIHGERDAVVPPHHGRALLAAANEPKEAVFYPQVHHYDFDWNVITAELLRFAKTHRVIN